MEKHQARRRADANPSPPLHRQRSGLLFFFFVNERWLFALREVCKKQNFKKVHYFPLLRSYRMGYRIGVERAFQPPGSVGDIQDLGIQSVRDEWECVWPSRERETRGPILLGLTWPPLQGARRSRSQRADSGVVPSAEEGFSRCLRRLPRARQRPRGRGEGGGLDASCARGEGVGRAALSGPTRRSSSFRPKAQRAQLRLWLGLSLLPGPPSAQPSLPPSSFFSSVRRSSSGQAAWRPWRHGCARRTAAAVRPSSNVPPASSSASRARTSARR